MDYITDKNGVVRASVHGFAKSQWRGQRVCSQPNVCCGIREQTAFQLLKTEGRIQLKLQGVKQVPLGKTQSLILKRNYPNQTELSTNYRI